MRRVFRRPSPAMLVAIAALIVALGGTAVAGGVLNKKKVKNISNNQITNRAPGLSVNNAKTADKASNVLWAIVDNPSGAANASLFAAGQSGTTVTEATGVQVRFSRSVQNCAWNATKGLVPGAGGASPAGYAQVNGTGDPNVVEVRTRDATGTISDADFHLVVSC